MKTFPSTTYEINGLFKHAERDDWEHGCDPKSGTEFGIDESFSAPDIPRIDPSRC